MKLLYYLLPFQPKYTLNNPIFFVTAQTKNDGWQINLFTLKKTKSEENKLSIDSMGKSIVYIEKKTFFFDEIFI